MTSPKTDTKQIQLQTIQARCAATGLEAKILPEEKTNQKHLGRTITIPTRITVNIPEERSKAQIFIFSGKIAQHALESRFEKYKRLRDYQGIWSEEDQRIECALSGGQIGQFVNTQHLLESLLESEDPNDQTKQAPQLKFKIPGTDAIAMLTQASSEQVLLNSTRTYPDPILGEDFEFRQRPITLHIIGLNISQHNQATEIIERVSNSILLALDLHTNFPFRLKRRIEKPRQTKQQPDKSKARSIPVPGPLQAYWLWEEVSSSDWSLPLVLHTLAQDTTVHIRHRLSPKFTIRKAADS
ncbi:MAG: hypothetical protein EOP84_20520 [Verrucomicrobiaceae bacterium]|nr:MAG: hypothetical protein EOP84_20520 [Verrucomicrobiaceae bacterium]